MDQRFDDLIAYLRGRKPLSRADTPAMYADYLETLRPLLEQADEPEVALVRRGPGRPRKQAEVSA